MFEVGRAVSGAVETLRGVDVQMTSVVSALCGPGRWAGPDADRFERDWAQSVSSRLRSACAKLDVVGVAVVPEAAGVGGG